MPRRGKRTQAAPRASRGRAAPMARRVARRVARRGLFQAWQAGFAGKAGARVGGARRRPPQRRRWRAWIARPARSERVHSELARRASRPRALGWAPSPRASSAATMPSGSILTSWSNQTSALRSLGSGRSRRASRSRSRAGPSPIRKARWTSGHLALSVLAGSITSRMRPLEVSGPSSPKSARSCVRFSRSARSVTVLVASGLPSRASMSARSRGAPPSAVSRCATSSITAASSSRSPSVHTDRPALASDAGRLRNGRPAPVAVLVMRAGERCGLRRPPRAGTGGRRLPRPMARSSRERPTGSAQCGRSRPTSEESKALRADSPPSSASVSASAALPQSAGSR